MALSDLGTDMSCTDDLNPSITEVSGARLLAEAQYRRLISPRGSLYRSPDYGTDIRNKVGSEAYPEQLRRDVESELVKDERVLDVSTTVTFVDTNELAIELDREIGTMVIQVNGTTDVGPFELVVGVDDVSIELLELS